MTEQTVVDDSNTVSEETVSDDNALDSLLNEYDEGTKEAPASEASASGGQLDEVVSYIQQEREQKIRENANKAINEAVNVIKGESDLPDIVFRGILHAKAEEDPRILQAFQNRESNPGGWQKVLNAIGKEVQTSLPKEDAKLSQDKEALASAVQSASTKQSVEQEVDWGGLSDSEFNRKKAEMLRKG